jgi:hypothetical protein
MRKAVQPKRFALEVTAEQWFAGENKRYSCTLHAQGRSSYYPDLPCQPYVYVALSYAPWPGRKKPWHLDCQLEQADEYRSQWNHCCMYATLEEASQMAADFALVALPLLWKSMQTGEVQETPGDRRSVDATAYAERETAQLGDEVGRLKQALSGFKREDDEVRYDVLWAKKRDAENRYIEAWRKAEMVFHRAHDWREYRNADVCEACDGTGIVWETNAHTFEQTESICFSCGGRQ